MGDYHWRPQPEAVREAKPNVSIPHTERSGRLAAGGGQQVRSTSISTRLNRLLFSSKGWPWLVLDVVLALVLYELGLRFSPYGTYSTVVSPYVALSVVYAIAFGAIALGLGSYDRDTRFDYFATARIAVVSTALASLVNLAFHYFTLYAVVGRLTLVYGAVFALLGVGAVRAALTWVVRHHPYRFTVVGSSAAAFDVLNHWARSDQARMYQLVPWTDISAEGELPTLAGVLDANIAEIVVTADAMSEHEAIDVALLGLRASIPVVDERSFYARLFERLPIDDVSKRWILEQGLARPQAVVVGAKRLADLLLSACGLVILSPLLALIALSVRLSGPGPILFVQMRQGRFFEPFRMYKFRTMRHETNADEGGFTRVADSRVTRVGRVLRRTHLDELPQLLNILRGEMSLVGPRPETVEFARRMDDELPLYELRYLVRPGVTGHAQLKQGYAMDTVLDTREKLSYDLYYLCNFSMRMDIQLLIRTFLFLIRGSR